MNARNGAMTAEDPRTPLHEHVMHQLRAGYGTLWKSVQGLSEAQARDGAAADWRRFRWGAGLDGSIAGIVHHAALWKHLFAQGLATGRFPTEDEISPSDSHWPALCQWLAEGQLQLEIAIQPLADTALAEVREWEGHSEPLAHLLTYLIEHDVYHAGQV